MIFAAASRMLGNSGGPSTFPSKEVESRPYCRLPRARGGPDEGGLYRNDSFKLCLRGWWDGCQPCKATIVRISIGGLQGRASSLHSAPPTRPNAPPFIATAQAWNDLANRNRAP